MSEPIKSQTRDVITPKSGEVYDHKTGNHFPFGPGGVFGTATDNLYQSEGHPINRNTGKRESGGPFHVTHDRAFVAPARIYNAISQSYPSTSCSGTVLPESFGIFSVPIAGNFNAGSLSSSPPSMDADGATAISQCSPTNPTANLGTSLAETFREGIPSLPGIQSWKNRTQTLRNAGSEYLNYQFGWAPLTSEIHSVVGAARHHRDIMQNYENGEGTNVHREFDFDDDIQVWNEDAGDRFLTGAGVPAQFFKGPARCSVTVERRVRKYFKGCFTYGGPSKTDSYGRALGFGKEADQVYGISLTPDVLWELAPWSWAVDWFSNTGDVINNITNFALAGLVMRYGYMMKETSYKMYCTWSDALTTLGRYDSKTDQFVETKDVAQGGGGLFGYEKVEKSRVPANPFGFGVGWEDLSPTQLAITAAIGITRLL
jgi:hypothetical protein